MRVFALISALATALSTGGSAQIPERAQWEITFGQVEAAAGLPDMRVAPPETFEARLMERPWSASAPLPFLRLVRADGALHAQLYLFWTSRYMAAQQRPTGPDIVCRDDVCVRPIEIKERRDWGQIIATLAHQDACPIGNRPAGLSCGDCEQIWIKTKADGSYREQSCQLPASGTPAREMLELMQRSALPSR